MFPPSFEIFCGDRATKFHNEVEPFRIKMEQLTARLKTDELTARLINLQLFPQFSYNSYRSNPHSRAQGFVFLQTEEGFCKTVLPIDGIYDEGSVWCVIKYRGRTLSKSELRKAEKQMWYIFQCEQYDKLDQKEKIVIREAVARFNAETKNKPGEKRSTSTETDSDGPQLEKVSTPKKHEYEDVVRTQECDGDKAPKMVYGTNYDDDEDD